MLKYAERVVRMNSFFIVLGIFLFGVILALFIQEYFLKKSRRQNIQKRFGTIPPERNYDYEGIASYWEEIKNQIPIEQQVDDITWNDLEMDKVYERINQCCSSVGEEYLYATLHQLHWSEEELSGLEEKIQYFGARGEERIKMMEYLLALGKKPRNFLIPFLNHTDIFEIPHILIYGILQFLLFGSLIGALVQQNALWITILIVIAGINLVVFECQHAKYERSVVTLSYITRLLFTAKKIVKSKETSFEETFHELQEPSSSFRSFSKSVQSLELHTQTRLSGVGLELIFEYIRGITLVDFTKYHKVMKALKGKKDSFFKIYHSIGQIDCAISILSFRYSSPFYCTPEFKSNMDSIKAEEIYHPLIQNAITNTISFDSCIILSGSNASGKSTFIKAIALNAILAQSIHTCLATQFVMPRSSIVTSMAVRDDIISGDSYFIRELNYLNRILSILNEERNTLCFIDEILRGTNTVERIAASIAVIKYLVQKNCISIVATHDVELTEELKDTCDNYHFREVLNEGDVKFDYKLYHGPTTTRNAILLLERMGYPEEIIRTANRYVNSITN
ncbi:MAG TPA: hypothetical protein DHW61_08210 [Lachnoclostridium phytofermentans]|uniref:DNA mismatch repair proteins mutS family domain-containing protein n=2 Tax=Lachnoclostridium TaxID=1506553 RepID=A0A3D2X6X2_9FIRM|nr:hypothetical protein [Lachnoclostridium phytofermentans]